MDNKEQQYIKLAEKSADKLYVDMKDFVDELLVVLPGETTIVLAKIYLHTQISKDKLIKKFCKKVLPVCDLVRKRNEDFFISGNYVDSILSDYNLQLDFRSIWKKISHDNKQQIWDWFDSFVDTAEQYNKFDKSLKLLRVKLSLSKS